MIEVVFLIRRDGMKNKSLSFMMLAILGSINLFGSSDQSEKLQRKMKDELRSLWMKSFDDKHDLSKGFHKLDKILDDVALLPDEPIDEDLQQQIVKVTWRMNQEKIRFNTDSQQYMEASIIVGRLSDEDDDIKSLMDDSLTPLQLLYKIALLRALFDSLI
jgi:hypothetical protein